MKMRYFRVPLLLIILCAVLSGCMSRSEQAMGTVGGAAAGAGVMALLHAPKPILFLGTLAGGAVGYYMTSRNFEDRNLRDVNGQIVRIGQRIAIDLPSTALFEIETSELLGSAPEILNDVASVLSQVPNHRIVVTAHTNGIDRMRRERPLSVRRADVVSNYLKSHGVNVYRDDSANEQRQWASVGRAFDAPISNSITLQGIRENSHVYILAYPSVNDLKQSKQRYDAVKQGSENIGAYKN